MVAISRKPSKQIEKNNSIFILKKSVMRERERKVIFFSLFCDKTDATKKKNDHTLFDYRSNGFSFKSYKKIRKKGVSCYLCNSKFCCHHTQIGMKFKTTLRLSIDLFTLVKINHIFFFFFIKPQSFSFVVIFYIIVCGNFISPHLCFICHYYRRKKKYFNELNHQYSGLIHKVFFHSKRHIIYIAC